MNKTHMYDQFGEDYDRFVDWEGRLAIEIPFLKAELGCINKSRKTSILDAACGTGHHLIALAEAGFECTGADISEKMVEIARSNALNAQLEIPFKQAGFGYLTQAFGRHQFDGLICLGNSLPHVLDQITMLKTLADFKKVIRPGGKLILQNRNFDSVIKTRNRWMEPQTYREGSQTWIFVRYYDFDPDGLITFHVLILSDHGGENFHQRITNTRLWPLTKDQMVHFLAQAGFDQIQLYGDLQGSKFEIETSGNLVITARV